MIRARFIGVGRFADPSISELTGCVRDATALWALFQDGAPGIDAAALVDAQATLEKAHLDIATKPLRTPEWTLFDEGDARVAGTGRADVEAVEKAERRLRCPARRSSATTGRGARRSNAKEFARAPGLKWEDWAASRR